MLIVGLTGGIGSGKTTTAKLFAEHGVPVIDADVIAKHLAEPGQPAFEPILSHFGTDLLATDGTLDRAKLRKHIFTHPEERAWLEACLHPLIRTQIELEIAKLEVPYCIVVIPLLAEAGTYPLLQRVLVVDAHEHLQVERAAERDQAHTTHIQTIIKSQASRTERLAIADDILINNGSITQLAEDVKKLHDYYLHLSLQ